MRHLTRFAFVSAALVAASFVPGSAGVSTALASGYSPRVPVSQFSIPSWFDPSRLQVSSSVTVGGGYGGTGGLSVTSFSYRFGNPLAVSVNLGNAFGGGTSRSGSGFFLEGLNVAYRPRPSLEFQFHYHDVRSPLQYGFRNSTSFWSP